LTFLTDIDVYTKTSSATKQRTFGIQMSKLINQITGPINHHVKLMTFIL